MINSIIFTFFIKCSCQNMIKFYVLELTNSYLVIIYRKESKYLLSNYGKLMSVKAEDKSIILIKKERDEKYH